MIAVASPTTRQTQQGELRGKIAVSEMWRELMDRERRESGRPCAALFMWVDAIPRARSRWWDHCVEAGRKAGSGTIAASRNENTSLPDGSSRSVSVPHKHLDHRAGSGVAEQRDSESRGCADGAGTAGESQGTSGTSRRIDLGVVPCDEETTKVERRL